MTKDDVQFILDIWAARLNLTNWDIKIRWELRPGMEPDGTGEAEKGIDAEIKVHDYHEQASNRLAEDWPSWSRDQMNRTLVHELLHIYEKETHRPVDQARNVMSGPTFEMFWGWYVAGRERWVEKLAQALVDLAGTV